MNLTEKKTQSRYSLISPMLQWPSGQLCYYLCIPGNVQRWQFYTTDLCRLLGVFQFKKQQLNCNPATTFWFHLHLCNTSMYRILLHFLHWTPAWHAELSHVTVQCNNFLCRIILPAKTGIFKDRCYINMQLNSAQWKKASSSSSSYLQYPTVSLKNSSGFPTKSLSNEQPWLLDFFLRESL